MDFKKFCDGIAKEVSDTINPLIGTKEAAKIVMMGADGTPTKKIDKLAEDIVINYLLETAFCKTLISEEAGCRDMGGQSGTIYLDPLDGTHNAVTGNPFYALSIAYAEDNMIKKAYVNDLAHNESFYAEKGKGAFFNKKKVKISNTRLLENSTISIYGKKFEPETIVKIGEKIRRWRLYGASALEICYVGCGRLDGFVDIRNTLRVTDAAAGILFCKEAGGTVTDKDGCEIKFSNDVSQGRCLVATNGLIHKKVIEYLR
ncbi:bifunctional fructose-bisphosphatase/inositol-phosphate phosphatase [Methanoplanus sp. FWC-SCC4]|uniref:fructose-bisphosphatase n=1 Tax=Methanochimaera problematica TaxID=2609417 RepID=A0AA97FB66_9EURY|nr:bifunctional fructose-bisphosphatase/inositol-phosphate phosphatase [Methanoplanus sp. FWC-SCC4]WOF16195.1 bifunctional fructose-bisphosphatase/inositol-phosphate phosphatase [Methanoplanus sp. FWC-SCC4]